jgi:predicted RNA-binding Zn-ribbon protein involved in translation (DUF1610 family)
VRSESVEFTDGDVGITFSAGVKIGLEYYLVLNHIADTKLRYKGPIHRDAMTGSIQTSKSETCIRYNWQELIAMLHSKSYSLASSIYNDPGSKGNYPYCTSCDRDVETLDDNRCKICGNSVDARVTFSKQLGTVKRLLQMLGVDMKISADVF